MALKLDALDRKILYSLDCNARISISDLSRQMRFGRDIVDYRVTRLFNEGIIVRAGAVVDPYQLGLTLFKSYLRLNNNRSRCAQLLARLKKNSKVFCVAHCDGQWDIVFNSLARTAREFDSLQEELLSPFGDIIADSEIAVVVEQRYYPKKFLVGKGQGGFVIGTETNDNLLNEFEAKLLTCLVQDARLPITSVSEKLSSSPMTVKRSIDLLESKKIIIGYRIDVNRVFLGITRFKTQITFEKLTRTRSLELQKFCEQHPNISNYIKQVGRYKLECAVDAENYEHFNKIIDEVRSSFCDVIHSVGTLLIREETYRWVSDEVGEIAQIRAA